MRDLLSNVRPSDFYASFNIPFVILYRNFYALGKEDVSKIDVNIINNLPFIIWEEIRKISIRSSVLPLGTISERAVKKLLNSFLSAITKKEMDLLEDHEKVLKFRETLQHLSVNTLFYNYIHFWFFEAAIYNLRGNSDHLHNDYGFLYHWSKNKKYKSLEEESLFRKQLFNECKLLAHKLNFFWIENGSSRFEIPNQQKLGEGIEKILKVPVYIEHWKKDKPVRRINISGISPESINNIKIPFSQEKQCILFDGKYKNAFIDLAALADGNKEIDLLLLDLLEIATIIYLGDIYIKRNKSLSRDLVFLIPVHHPDIWSQSKSLLEYITSFLTFNYTNFIFIQKESKKPLTKKKFEIVNDERCVSLFSGGFDSFVGAIDLLKNGNKPYFVSHEPSPLIKNIQRNLIHSIKDSYPDLTHYGIRVNKMKNKSPWLQHSPNQILYQYARSFLFLSLATCVAIQKKTKNLYVFENGPISLNPTFSEARFNTRTTHPIFLNNFKKLIAQVFGVDLNIMNPYAFKTKGDILSGLDEKWLEVIHKSNSCWSPSKVKIWAQSYEITNFDGRHCGRCLPCIWRRSAFHRLNYSKYDDDYLWDYVPETKWNSWLNREHITPILDQLRFYQNALEKNNESLANFCPDFYSGFSSVDNNIKLYKRFSKENLSFMCTVKDKLHS